MDKRLLTIKEAMVYTGIGETKMREIVDKHPEFKVIFPETNKVYIFKDTFDKWIKAHLCSDKTQ